jgi:hypothetical protein
MMLCVIGANPAGGVEENQPSTQDQPDSGLQWNENIVATYYGNDLGTCWGGYGNRLHPNDDYFCALPASVDDLDVLGGTMACRIGECDGAGPALDELLAWSEKTADPDNAPMEFWPGTGPADRPPFDWVIRGAEGDGLFRVIEIKPADQEGPILEAYVGDVGPWCQNDPYWESASRPNAEDGLDSRGRSTNRAGIDISYALARAMGSTGIIRVDWRWKTVDGAYVVTRRVTEWRN